MKHRYLVIDGEIYGTGIRDKYEGFIDPNDLPVSQDLIKSISEWKSECDAIFANMLSATKVPMHELDLRGLELLKKIRLELDASYKIEYVLFITGKQIIITPNGEYVSP